MQLSELKEKTEKELLKHLGEFKKELMNLRFQKTNGETVSGARIKLLRTSVARVKTLLKQKLYGGSVNA